MAPLVRQGALRPQDHYRGCGKLDAIIICVPTPLNEQKEPDLKYVAQTSDSISWTLRKGQLIILESTTYPGTTEELILPILSREKLKAGKDFFVAYSPEREDPGNRSYPITIGDGLLTHAGEIMRPSLARPLTAISTDWLTSVPT